MRRFPFQHLLDKLQTKLACLTPYCPWNPHYTARPSRLHINSLFLFVSVVVLTRNDSFQRVKQSVMRKNILPHRSDNQTNSSQKNKQKKSCFLSAALRRNGSAEKFGRNKGSVFNSYQDVKRYTLVSGRIDKHCITLFCEFATASYFTPRVV